MPVQGRAIWIPDYLSKWQVPFEVIPGWENRGKPGGRFIGGVSVTHHIGIDGTDPAPGLRTVVHGRSDLRNSLANVHTDRAPTPKVRVVAAGVCWHAGDGGWRGRAGNTRSLGNEVEGTVGQIMKPAQRELVVITTVALLDGMASEEGDACQHGEWAPGRKVDNWDLMRDPGGFRADVARTLHHIEEDLSIVDKQTQTYLDMQFAALNQRVDGVEEILAGRVPGKPRARSFIGRIGDKLGVKP